MCGGSQVGPARGRDCMWVPSSTISWWHFPPRYPDHFIKNKAYMTTHQHPLTLVTPVKSGQQDNLNGLLMQIRKDVQAGQPVGFENLGTIHYARWVLLEPKD